MEGIIIMLVMCDEDIIKIVLVMRDEEIINIMRVICDEGDYYYACYM